MPHPPTSPPPAGDTGPEETAATNDLSLRLARENIAAGVLDWNDSLMLLGRLDALQARYDDLNDETGRWGLYGVLQRRVEALEAELARSAARVEAAEAERHTLLVALWRTTKGWIKSPGKRTRADLPPSQPTCRWCKRVFQNSSSDLSWHEPDCPVVVAFTRVFDESGAYRPEFASLGAVAAPGGSARGEG